MSDEAKAIYQDVLDGVTNAYLRGDWAAYKELLVLPQRFGTFDGTLSFETEETLKVMFERYCEMLKQLQVRELVRLCDSAVFRKDGSIEGTHISHFLRNGQPVTDSYPAKSFLERRDGRWKVVSSENAIDRTSMPFSAFNCVNLEDQYSHKRPGTSE
ncbi:MAG: hypothetical protein AAFY03_08610 [Pseudomonadota bacterium]